MGYNFWRYLVAQSVSNIGSAVGRFALYFLVYELTGSTVAMGALLIVSTVPEVILRLLGAPLIDRLPRLKLMGFLDLTRAVVYLVPWLFFYTGHPTIWVLYLVSFVGGAAGALYSPASMAIIPSLVPGDKLVKANSLISTVNQVLWVAGPMVGVAICAFLGNANALIVDGISFTVCGLALIFSVKAQPTPSLSRREGLAGYKAELIEGFAVYRQIPALLTITVVLAISNIGSIGSMTMLLPFIRDHLGGSNALVGTIETGFPIGALLASLFATTFVLRIRRAHLMLSGLILIQLAQITSALLTPNLAFVMVGAWALYGFGSATYSIHSNTIYQQLIPDHLRGRAMSVRMLTGQGLQPIGQLIGTWIATQWGPSSAFLIGGGIPLIITLCAFFFPSLRNLDQVGQEPKEEKVDSLPAKQGAPTTAANSSQ